MDQKKGALLGGQLVRWYDDTILERSGPISKGFIKTVPILSNPMTHIHVHITIPKGLTIDRGKQKKKQNSTKRKIREKREREKKKTDIPFNFYIVEFGDSQVSGEQKTLERNASSLTLFS